jgi:hypothetical protein
MGRIDERLKHAVDGRRRDADLMVAPQEEAQPHDPVLSFLTDAEDQRLDLRRCAMGTRARPPRTVPETRDPLSAVPAVPSVELVPGDPEEAARLTNVSGDLLVVLNHPEPGLRPPG